jgi:lysophospholipase L1-like esterase
MANQFNTIYLNSLLIVKNYLNITLGSNINTSYKIDTEKIIALGIVDAPIKISSRVATNIKELILRGTETHIENVTLIDIVVDVYEKNGPQSINNFTVAYAHAGGAIGSAVRFNGVQSGVYKKWYIYQTTWGMKFTGSSCSVTLDNITMVDTLAGSTGIYLSGGSVYLSNHDHNVTFRNSRIDWEHITFAGALGKVTSYESVLKVACLGDSLTQGGPTHVRMWDYRNRHENMSNQYVIKLSERLSPHWWAMNMGEGGDTIDSTNSLLARMNGAIKQKPDALIIMIGFNDFNWINHTMAQIRTSFNNLFSYIKSTGQQNVFICRIAPSDTIHNNNIMLMNDWLAGGTPNQGAPAYGFKIINETFWNLTEGSGDNTLKESYEWDGHDGIHFNELCYDVLADIFDDYLRGLGAPKSVNVTKIIKPSGITSTRKVIYPDTYKIPVVLGWNMLSIPFSMGINSNPSSFIDLDGDTLWDRMMLYDSSDTTNRWKQHYSKWATSLNDLKYIDMKMGFWLNVSAVGDGYINVSGLLQQSTIIQLRAGWNLVGYPTISSNTTVANAFWGTSASIVEVFDFTSPYKTKIVGPTYIMKPGEGYWVYVSVDSVWYVDW